jgi:hypothetical protein
MAIVDDAREYFLTFLMCRKYCRSSSSLMRWGGLAIVIGELPDSANIGFLSSFRETSELKTLDHSLPQFGHRLRQPFARFGVMQCRSCYSPLWF